MKKKMKRQPQTTKIHQYNDGLIRVSTKFHNGRVTIPCIGPASDNAEMAQEMFRIHARTAQWK